MSQDRLPPPEEEVCLVRLRPSTQKGGTIIAEDVTDLVTHERRLCDPDGYRPKFCPKCRETTLHVHDYRPRNLRAEPGQPATWVVRHKCVGCEAIWQVLPVFIARNLWRTWRVVEHTLMGATPLPAEAEARRWPTVPARTRRRWFARWLRPARYLARVLCSCGGATWVGVLAAGARCADLVAAYAGTGLAPAGHLLAAVAALVYRLEPKVRFM
jgi:hypothetical protein